jgi:hypothetical protein
MERLLRVALRGLVGCLQNIFPMNLVGRKVGKAGTGGLNSEGMIG